MSYKIEKDHIVFTVIVKPNKKETKIVACESSCFTKNPKDHITIFLNAPPIDGKANEELISFLAKEFGIAKSKIELVRGQKSKQKQIRVPFSVEIQRKLYGFW